MTEAFDLIIIGAGPAGLFCAISSGKPHKQILVLEERLTGTEIACLGLRSLQFDS